MKNFELKKRRKSSLSEQDPRLLYNIEEELPYGGKVFIARQKKPDSWPMIIFQAFLILFAIGLILYAYYYFEHFHFHVTRAYAHLGYDTAQHHLANKYLRGHGVEKEEDLAMQWYKEAAEQGHPHAAYNLAIGHLRGLKSGLNAGEARKLIEHAAEHGVPEAHHTLHNVCSSGGCDD
jgi:hypothetical protein